MKDTLKPPLGGMIPLHAAPADPGAPCRYCAKPQPWGDMEPCDGPMPLRAEIARLREDSARLDALDDGTQRHLDISRSRKNNKDYWRIEEWFIGNEHTTRVIASGEGWTLRQAIDAFREDVRKSSGLRSPNGGQE